MVNIGALKAALWGGECMERSGYGPNFLIKMMIKVGKTQEVLELLPALQCGPILNHLDFLKVHGDGALPNNEPEEADRGCVEVRLLSFDL